MLQQPDDAVEYFQSLTTDILRSVVQVQETHRRAAQHG